MVLIRDPEAVKEVYSAEGQYPARSESKKHGLVIQSKK